MSSCLLRPRSLLDPQLVHLGLAGQPISHSLSPHLHLHNAQACDLALKYSLFDEDRVNFIQRVTDPHFSLSLDGLNVTTPHKTAAYQISQVHTPTATLLEAVNTLGWSSTHELIGHNTDVVGAQMLLDQYGNLAAHHTVLLFGTGGASRAICLALINRGVRRIYWVSRDRHRARQTIQWLQALCPDVTTGWYGLEGEQMGDLPSVKGVIDVVASGIPSLTTTQWNEIEHLLGAQFGKGFGLPPDGWFFDLNYAERAQGTRDWAERHLINYRDGFVMLIAQGIASFEWWTGLKVSVDSVLKKMREHLV